MKAADMVPVTRKNRGAFVALSLDRKKVWGRGRTADAALRAAQKKGKSDPLLARIPEDGRNYLL
jgi:hypothetical protein